MARSDVAVLVDPLHYNPIEHGPPYLPGQQEVPTPMKTAHMKTAIKGMVDREAAFVGEAIQHTFQHMLADYGGAPGAELAVLLAALQAEALVHQSHHWVTRGPTAYGDHLLFDRVYSEVFGMVDRVAERAVGVGTEVLVHPLLQSHHQTALVRSFYHDAPLTPGPEDMVLLSLRAVLRFLVLLDLVHAAMEAKGTLTHGVDNLLQGFADQHEMLVYLLKQRAAGNSVLTAASRPVSDPAWKR